MTAIPISRQHTLQPLLARVPETHPLRKEFLDFAYQQPRTAIMRLSALEVQSLYAQMDNFARLYPNPDDAMRIVLERAKHEVLFAIRQQLQRRANVPVAPLVRKQSRWRIAAFWAALPFVVSFAACDGFCGAMSILETFFPMHLWLCFPASVFSVIAILIIIGFDLREISLNEDISFLNIASCWTVYHQQQQLLNEAFTLVTDLVNSRLFLPEKFLAEIRALQKLLGSVEKSLDRQRQYGEIHKPKLPKYIQTAKFGVTALASSFYISSGVFVGKAAATYYLTVAGISLATPFAGVLVFGMGMVCGAGMFIGFAWLQRRGLMQLFNIMVGLPSQARKEFMAGRQQTQRLACGLDNALVVASQRRKQVLVSEPRSLVAPKTAAGPRAVPTAHFPSDNSELDGLVARLRDNQRRLARLEIVPTPSLKRAYSQFRCKLSRLEVMQQRGVSSFTPRLEGVQKRGLLQELITEAKAILHDQDDLIFGRKRDLRMFYKPNLFQPGPRPTAEQEQVLLSAHGFMTI